MPLKIDPLSVLIGFALATVGWVIVGVAFFFVRPWFRCLLSGAPVSLMSLLGMRLRGQPVTLLCDAMIALVQSGRPTRMPEVEKYYLIHKGRIVTAEDLIELVRKSMEKV